jgi:hypothetical protein
MLILLLLTNNTSNYIIDAERRLSMFQRVFRTIIILTAFILLTAMGGTGGLEQVPRVDKNYSVVITDSSGTKIEGEKFSWEGRIHFAGNIGMAQVTIPFDRVKELIAGERRDRFVRVTARLIDGSETSFDIDAKTRCYGEAKFGNFIILVEEIKTITFKR